MKGGRSWLGSAALAVTSVTLLLLVLELGLRVVERAWTVRDFLAEERSLFTAGYPSQYDADLGWIPKEGFRGSDNVWRTMVSIGSEGIRSNGRAPQAPPLHGAPILAVGDSFTFGDQVSDAETWPAVLEGLLGRPVHNGGVFGYGLDQAYLRAEQLVPRLKPGILIFSIFPEDIYRCQLSERTAVGKPYFEVVRKALVLKNVPVPRPTQERSRSWIRRSLGHSLLVHRLMMRCWPGVWLEGLDWWKQTVAHQNPVGVVCRLLVRLDALKHQGVTRTYVLVQYDAEIQHTEILDKVIVCARGPSVQVVDLRADLRALKARDPQAYQRLFHGHMTAEGNRFVAEKLRDVILAR